MLLSAWGHGGYDRSPRRAWQNKWTHTYITSLHFTFYYFNIVIWAFFSQRKKTAVKLYVSAASLWKEQTDLNSSDIVSASLCWTDADPLRAICLWPRGAHTAHCLMLTAASKREGFSFSTTWRIKPRCVAHFINSSYYNAHSQQWYQLKKVSRRWREF